MLVRTNKLGIPVRRYYFACQQRPGWWESLMPTAYFDCYQQQKPGKVFFTRKGYTLLTDLTLPEDQLFSGLSRKTRNEIRRYERGSDYLLMEDAPLDDFMPAYNDFAARRGLSLFTAEDALAYGSDHLHLMSMAREGRSEIFDLYLCDRETQYVTGFLSCSPIDYIHDKQQRRQLSIARRFLLWFSILYFKRAGFSVYDWGGYAPDDPNPVIRQISEFKRSFKGEVSPVYHFYSPAYQAMEELRELLKGLRGGRMGT
ncbi:MAG: hypothetical protein R3F02_00795 [Thiolinea sp.]